MIYFVGYEQQNGDNNQWLNADGTEVTFTYWDLNWSTPQPDSDEHACVRSNYADTIYWHDIPCENNFTGNDRYACRFETTADEQVGKHEKYLTSKVFINLFVILKK